MRNALLAVSFLLPMLMFGQTGPVITDVYKFSNASISQAKPATRTTLLTGSTLDLANLDVILFTLPANTKKPQRHKLADKEQLIIVKNGSIKLSVEGKTKQLNAGGLAMINANDEQEITSADKKPASYYIIILTAKQKVNIERGKNGGGSFMADWKDFVVKQTDKGQSRPIFDQPSSMFPRFEVHATTLNPGISSHAAHTHRVEEIILMISGNGSMQLGDEFKETRSGDVIFVNSMVPHAITNVGNKPCSYFAIQWHAN